MHLARKANAHFGALHTVTRYFASTGLRVDDDGTAG